MGDKVSAKKAMIRAGVPVVPGSEGVLKNGQDATALAKEIGFPVLMKAAGGGGGKGMKIAEKAEDVAELFDLAQIEAQTHFGNPDVYMEKYLLQPRHIEIQLLGDQHGNVIHLGERDCSLQRRHQKVLEEAPSPALTDAERAHIGAIAVKAAKDIGYYSAGTFEFLYAQGQFYFIEMNTRLQVEHCVTEAITGIDLVKEQLCVAAGLPLSVTQDQVRFHGHAIEYRINAEHPETFVPSPGLITRYHAPGGPGVRIDAAIYDGYRVPPFYDSLVSKLVIHGNTRADCLARSRRALDEYVIEGIQTTIPLHQRLLNQPDIQTGHYDIHWLERFLKA
jgi:acetyl-CoA carboxylase biotin carboxylase subunit